jgi:hypothetical protein
MTNVQSLTANSTAATKQLISKFPKWYTIALLQEASTREDPQGGWKILIIMASLSNNMIQWYHLLVSYMGGIVPVFMTLFIPVSSIPN